jgi:hypothetical protein
MQYGATRAESTKQMNMVNNETGELGRSQIGIALYALLKQLDFL